MPALAGERGEPSPVRQHTNGVEGMANACQTRSKRPETTTYPPEQPPIRLLYRAPEISPMLCRCAARTQEGVIKSLQPHTHQYRRPEVFTRAGNKEYFPTGVAKMSPITGWVFSQCPTDCHANGDALGNNPELGLLVTLVWGHLWPECDRTRGTEAVSCWDSLGLAMSQIPTAWAVFIHPQTLPKTGIPSP